MNKKGFTMAELLIVVAIIAVLVAVSVPVFTQLLNNDDKSKGEDTRSTADNAKIEKYELNINNNSQLDVGDKVTINVTLAGKKVEDFTLTSSNESIISIDGNKIVGVAVGKSYITVKHGNLSKKMKFTVRPSSKKDDPAPAPEPEPEPEPEPAPAPEQVEAPYDDVPPDPPVDSNPEPEQPVELDPVSIGEYYQ